MLKVHSIKFFLSIILLHGATLFAQEINGTWNGLLEVQGLKIRLNINLEQKDNQYSGTLDSPDQGVAGIPLSKVVLENNTFEFKVEAAGLSYSGTLDREAGRI